MEKETQPAPPRHLLIRDVAALLGYTTPTVLRLTELETDPLPYTRLPGTRTQRRFKRAEVEAWIARNITKEAANG